MPLPIGQNVWVLVPSPNRGYHRHEPGCVEECRVVAADAGAAALLHPPPVSGLSIRVLSDVFPDEAAALAHLKQRTDALPSPFTTDQPIRDDTVPAESPPGEGVTELPGCEAGGPDVAWVDEGEESYAGVGDELLAVTWPEGGTWQYQVQRGEDVLAGFTGCRDREESSLAAVMWALGYLRGRADSPTSAASGSTPGPSAPSSPSPTGSTDSTPSAGDSPSPGPPAPGPTTTSATAPPGSPAATPATPGRKPSRKPGGRAGGAGSS